MLIPFCHYVINFDKKYYIIIGKEFARGLSLDARHHVPVIALRKSVQREPKDMREIICGNQRNLESRVISNTTYGVIHKRNNIIIEKNIKGIQVSTPGKYNRFAFVLSG
jgi:hypothetical protein